MKRSRRLAARLWWATLPYEGWVSYSRPEDVVDGATPAPWWAWPLAWLHRLSEHLPGWEQFEPEPEVVCTCDYCRGVPGAVWEP